jgi:hypothetical protein
MVVNGIVGLGRSMSLVCAEHILQRLSIKDAIRPLFEAIAISRSDTVLQITGLIL